MKPLHLAIVGVCLGCRETKPPVLPEETADTSPQPVDDTDTDLPYTPPPPEPNPFCPAPAPAPGDATVLGPGDDIQAALDAATTGDVIALDDGRYENVAPLTMSTSGVTLRGLNGDASLVILDRDYAEGTFVTLRASDLTLEAITLNRSGGLGVEIRPPEDASISGTTIRHVHILDPAGPAILVDRAGVGLAFFPDEGTIACNHLELTTNGRANVLGVCATGGIDIRQAAGWTVQDNFVQGFYCDVGEAAPGIATWQGSRDTLIERNLIHESPLGISLGLGEGAIGRIHDDLPCGGIRAQHYGGVVRNNMVWAAGDFFDKSEAGVSGGIFMESVCEGAVVHNSTWSDLSPEASIVFRYAITDGVAANNLSSHNVLKLEGATTLNLTNVEGATTASFVSTTTGDLHLVPESPIAIDAGTPKYAKLAPADLDGDERADGEPDAGADELPDQ